MGDIRCVRRIRSCSLKAIAPIRHRTHQFWQYRGNGQQQNVFDGGKGLELIPTGTNELLINPPAYRRNPY